jgi:hypothetical protein
MLIAGIASLVAWHHAEGQRSRIKSGNDGDGSSAGYPMLGRPIA